MIPARSRRHSPNRSQSGASLPGSCAASGTCAIPAHRTRSQRDPGRGGRSRRGQRGPGRGGGSRRASVVAHRIADAGVLCRQSDRTVVCGCDGRGGRRQPGDLRRARGRRAAARCTAARDKRGLSARGLLALLLCGHLAPQPSLRNEGGGGGSVRSPHTGESSVRRARECCAPARRLARRARQRPRRRATSDCGSGKG